MPSLAGGSHGIVSLLEASYLNTGEGILYEANRFATHRLILPNLSCKRWIIRIIWACQATGLGDFCSAALEEEEEKKKGKEENSRGIHEEEFQGGSIATPSRIEASHEVLRLLAPRDRLPLLLLLFSFSLRFVQLVGDSWFGAKTEVRSRSTVETVHVVDDGSRKPQVLGLSGCDRQSHCVCLPRRRYFWCVRIVGWTRPRLLDVVETTIFVLTMNWMSVMGRWELSAIDPLPFCMKITYIALFETTNKIAQMVYKEHGWNPIDSLKNAVYI